MKQPTLYVLVNTDLNMSIGKTAAQVAHAASRAKKPSVWGKGLKDTVIVLEASGEQIGNLSKYLEERKIKTHVVIDEGVNEISPYSVTAMSVDIAEREDLKEILSDFTLLGWTDELKKIMDGGLNFMWKVTLALGLFVAGAVIGSGKLWH